MKLADTVLDIGRFVGFLVAWLVGMDEGCVSGPAMNTALNKGVCRHTALILVIALGVSIDVTLLYRAVVTNLEQKVPSLKAFKTLSIIEMPMESTVRVRFTAIQDKKKIIVKELACL